MRLLTAFALMPMVFNAYTPIPDNSSVYSTDTYAIQYSNDTNNDFIGSNVYYCYDYLSQFDTVADQNADTTIVYFNPLIAINVLSSYDSNNTYVLNLLDDVDGNYTLNIEIYSHVCTISMYFLGSYTGYGYDIDETWVYNFSTQDFEITYADESSKFIYWGELLPMYIYTGGDSIISNLTIDTSSADDYIYFYKFVGKLFTYNLVNNTQLYYHGSNNFEAVSYEYYEAMVSSPINYSLLHSVVQSHESTFNNAVTDEDCTTSLYTFSDTNIAISLSGGSQDVFTNNEFTNKLIKYFYIPTSVRNQAFVSYLCSYFFNTYSYYSNMDVDDISSYINSYYTWYNSTPTDTGTFYFNFLCDGNSYTSVIINAYGMVYYNDTISSGLTVWTSDDGWVKDSYRCILVQSYVQRIAYQLLLESGDFVYTQFDSSYNITNLFYDYANLPFFLLKNLFSFQILGTQVWVFITSLLTVALAIFIIRKVV